MSHSLARAVVITVSHTILLVCTLIVLTLTKRKRTAITLPFLIALTPGGAIGIILGVFFCKTVETTGTDVPVSFLAAAIGFLYLNILIVFYAERTHESLQRQHQLELAEEHFRMQEQYYAQLREDQNQTRAMFHGMHLFRINDFLYQDVYEEGLTDRIEIEIVQTAAYYAMLDQMK